MHVVTHGGSDQLMLVVVLMLATVLLVGVGERIRRPYPVLVTLLGVVMAVVPTLPNLRIEPDLILPLFLPPLIYAVAQRTSWRLLQARLRSILLLAGALVLVTVAAVAVTAYILIPGVTLAAAIALGAMVAPPDPVAAEAVAGQLRLPRRLVIILQTEGLCNDATALVVYQLAVSAVVSGHWSVQEAIARFCYASAAAVVIGLGIGWVARRLSGMIAATTARSGLTLVVPFATYLLADRVGASGVLAVLTAGLYLGQTAGDDSGVADRLTGRAFWDVVELLVTGLAFGLIGLELHEVLPSGSRLLSAAGHAAVICLVVVGMRFIWLLIGGPLSRRVSGRADPEGVPGSWREDIVLSWAGMRGLATIALALALPLTTDAGRPFPGREELLFCAFAVIAVTLVLQGLTLPSLVRSLGVRAAADIEQQAEHALVMRAYKASARRLRELDLDEDLPDDVVEALRERQKTLIVTLSGETVPEEYRERLATRTRNVEIIKRMYAQTLAAARQEILSARTERGMDPEAVDSVLRRLDLRSAHLL
jgi:monovalent cation/hydrogen antiporter